MASELTRIFFLNVNEKIKTFFLLLVIIFLFLIPQLLFIEHESTVNDETLYGWYVKEIRSDPVTLFSREIWQFHPPFFSAIASTLFWADPLVSVRLVSIILAVIAILLTFYLGSRLFSPFVGLFSAGLLASNVLFISTAHHGLLDSTMMVTALAIGVGMFHLPKKEGWGLIIIGTLLALLSKRSGFLIFGLAGVLLFIYYFFENKKKITQKMIMGGVLFGAILGVWLFFLRLFDHDIVTFYDYSKGFGTIAIQSIRIISKSIPLYYFPFFLLGLFYMRNEKMKLISIIVWIGVFVGLIFFPAFDPRYWLPVYPVIFWIMAVGVEKVSVLNPLLRKGLPLFCLGLILPGLVYGIYIVSHSYGGIGYSDTGKWIGENASTAVVYDGLKREIRYYSGIELDEWGGGIRYYPPTPEEFVAQIRSEKRPIFAIVGVTYNFFGPFYQTDAFLLQQGFEKVHSVYRILDGKETEVIRVYQYGNQNRKS